MDTIFFWNEKQKNGYLSNWYPAPIEFGDYVYTNSEQLFMARKALFFKDYDTFEKILDENDPKKVKALGRQVKNFDVEKWKSVMENIMYQTNVLKYSQNPQLLRKLLETRNAQLVEASPYDDVWGIKAYASEAMKDPKNWKGHNLLGYVLEQVRRKMWRCLLETPLKMSLN